MRVRLSRAEVGGREGREALPLGLIDLEHVLVDRRVDSGARWAHVLEGGGRREVGRRAELLDENKM